MKIAIEILWWILGLFGVGKADPVKDARKETEARVKAEGRASQLEAALKGQEAARKAEANAHAAEIRYQADVHAAENPIPVPKSEEEWQAILDAANEARRKRAVP